MERSSYDFQLSQLFSLLSSHLTSVTLCCAQAVAQAMTNFTKVCIGSASCVPDSTTQQEILSCAKLVAISNNQLINAGRSILQLPDDKIAKQTLQTAHQSIAAGVDNLMSVLGDLGADNDRTSGPINAAIEALLRLKAGVKGYAKAEAADVVGSCKEILKVCAKMIFAPNQAEVSSAVQETIFAFEKLINEASTLAKSAPNKQVGDNLNTASTRSLDSMIKVLEFLKGSPAGRRNPQAQQQLETTGEQVTAAVNQIIVALRRFPDQSEIDLISKGTDLDDVASQEMARCAQIIAEAAALLDKLKDDKDNQLPAYLKSVNTSIIDSATQIAKAVAMLVRAAAVAQKERTAAGKAKEGAKYHADPMWADGLISAAQEVSATIKELVNAAKNSAEGKGEEELLVATARMVNTATAHLQSASRSKADVNAPSQRDISTAAKAVTKATASLVHNAANLGKLSRPEEQEHDYSNLSGVKAQQAAHNINNKMLLLEVEIKKAQDQLFSIRKQKYEKP